MDFKTYLEVNKDEIKSMIFKFTIMHLMHENKMVLTSMSKKEKLVVMAKYLKDNTSVTQEEFMSMLNDLALKKYKKVADLYKGNDLIEQLRIHGGVHVAKLIENQKKASKEIQR